MKKHLFFFLAFMLCFAKISSSQVNSYIRTYGSNLRQEGASFIQMGDGGFTILGRTNSLSAGGDDILLIRLDPWGNIVFSKTYGNTGNDEGTCIKRASDGGFIILGRRTVSNSTYASVLLKTDSLGNFEWTKVYSLTSSQTPINIIETNDNAYVFVGRYTGGNEEGFMVKTDLQGNILWQKAFTGSNYDMLWDICLSHDGGYVVCGASGTYAVAGGVDFIVIKVDASGNTLWSRVAGDVNFNSLYTGIATADGGFLFAGYSISSNREVHLLKLNSAGDVKWAKTYASTFDEICPAVKEVPGGYLMYTWAYANNNFGAADIGLIRTDTVGNLLFSRKFGSTGGEGGIINNNTLQFLSDSTYGAVGYTQSFGYGANGSNVFFIKTNTQGLVANSCPSAAYTLTQSNMSVSVGANLNFVPGIFTTPAYTVLVNNPTLCTTNPCQQNNPFDVYLGADIDTCANSITLNAGNSGSSFLWNTGDQTQSLTVDSSGLYVVSIQNTCGTAVDSIMVDLTAGAIHVNLGADVDTCIGTNITLNAANPGATYLWSTGEQTPTINATTAGIYYVTVTGACNTGRDTININMVQANPITLNLGPDIILCQGASTQLNANGTNINNYHWNSGQATQTIDVSAGGNYWVSVNNECFIDRDTVMVSIINPPPVNANLGTDIDTCSGSVITLNAGNAGNNYLWNTGDTTQTINVFANGLYFVTVTGACSTDRDTIALNFATIQPFNINLGIDTLICPSSNIQLNAGISGLTYNWSTNQNTQTINVANPGTYWVIANNDCYTDIDSVTIGINTAQPVSVNLGTDIDSCTINWPITLNAANANNSYQWNTGAITQTIQVSTPDTFIVEVYNACFNDIDTIVISLNQAQPVSVNLGNDIDTCILPQIDLSTILTGTGGLLWNTGDTTDNITITQPGVYFVTYTNECYSDIDSITIVFNPSSAFTLTGDTLLCPLETTFIQPSINGNEYLWNDGSTNSTIQVSAPGTYWLQLTNQNGCISFDTVSVLQNNLPGVTLGADTTVCASSYTIQSAFNNGTIEWNNGDSTQSITVTQSGFYWATATNECGGVTDSVYVQIIPSLDSVLTHLPNVFTPNNDGINETFGLGGYNLLSIEGTMYIYNRWGRLVYKTSDLIFGWDGENHTEGVYYYILEYGDCNGNNAKKNGSVTLLRNK